MTTTQGAQANKNGRVFELMMIPIFKDAGFEIFSEADFKKNSIQNTKKKYVIKNSSYNTIYNEVGRTEFVIVFNDRKIRVEAKYQSVPGSIDEKYPYMLLNGIYRYPEKEIIFVVDGSGYKPGARKWLEDHINNNWLNYKEQGKTITLMTITQFANWFNHAF